MSEFVLNHWSFLPVQIQETGDKIKVTITYFNGQNPEQNFRYEAAFDKSIGQEDLSNEIIRMTAALIRKRLRMEELTIKEKV